MKLVGFGGTSLFGATQPAPQTNSIFGATTSTFGATQPAQQTTNIFGSTLTGVAQTGTTVKFEAVAGQGKANYLFLEKISSNFCFFFRYDACKK